MACRWLTSRLPGFSRLICNAAYVHRADYSHLPAICDTNSAASWLVAHLPKLCRASTSTFELHLTLDSGKTPTTPAHVQAHWLQDALLQTYSYYCTSQAYLCWCTRHMFE